MLRHSRRIPTTDRAISVSSVYGHGASGRTRREIRCRISWSGPKNRSPKASPTDRPSNESHALLRASIRLLLGHFNGRNIVTRNDLSLAKGCSAGAGCTSYVISQQLTLTSHLLH